MIPDLSAPANLRDFLSHVRVGRGCWLWAGAKDKNGYGRIGGTGTWPTLPILHGCDTPACVRPSHLREGSQQQNIAEVAVRGRMFNSRKTACPNGHPYDHRNRAGRVCRRCRAAGVRRWRDRHPEEARLLAADYYARKRDRRKHGN